MDSTHRGPEVFGHDNDGYGEDAGRRRSRDPLTEFGQQSPQQARVVQLFPGDFLLTVNPVDGSEVELCPPGEQPATPVRRTSAERTDRERAAAPPVPPGPPSPNCRSWSVRRSVSGWCACWREAARCGSPDRPDPDAPRC